MAAEYTASDFDYEYPPEAVAQRPLDDRSASRLLVLDRTAPTIAHRHFRDLAALFRPGDLLVRNASRVIRARLAGTRDNGRPAEVLLVHPEPGGTWQAMVHPGGKLKVGRRVAFGTDAVATVVGVLGGGLRRVAFEGALDVDGLMARYGHVPLPPYIERADDERDAERYQTVYATTDGSVAAPTAGLHFTADLLATLASAGVGVADVVLHVGPGTFKPVSADDPDDHVMHAEWYDVPPETADAVAAAKAGGGRVWAVGTTTVRTLEAAANGRDGAPVTAGSGWTDLFIRPPFAFRVVDAMLTNFHLPRSTLLMLVAAFGGYPETMQAYREAVREGYRLYSYGDAMALIGHV
jgi:S-adenosylmethionine:tRNA ribosyltransferase-isomerase